MIRKRYIMKLGILLNFLGNVPMFSIENSLRNKKRLTSL